MIKNNKIAIWASLIAILVCIGWIIYELISKNNDYGLWIVLLLLNVSTLFSNIDDEE